METEQEKTTSPIKGTSKRGARDQKNDPGAISKF